MLGDALGAFRRAQTERLELRAVEAGDLDDLYALLSDPRVWTHLPTEVHTDRARTAAQVARYAAAWDLDGLGYWTAWLKDGSFAGIGGCSLRGGPVWNLYYRIRPELQGNGYATELARAASAAAETADPGLPIVASVLAHNAASAAVAQASGLRLVWQGRDRGGPAAGALRLLFADREIGADRIAALQSAGADRP